MGAFAAVCLAAAAMACGPGTDAGGVASFQARSLASDSTVVSLQDLRGQPALLTTWAVWCTECRDELPALEQFWETNGGWMHVIAVNVDGASGPAQRMAKQFKLSMPVWHGTEPAFEKAFRTQGVPSSALVSADGHIVKTFFGPIDFDSDEFKNLVQEQLAGSNSGSVDAPS